MERRTCFIIWDLVTDFWIRCSSFDDSSKIFFFNGAWQSDLKFSRGKHREIDGGTEQRSQPCVTVADTAVSLQRNGSKKEDSSPWDRVSVWPRLAQAHCGAKDDPDSSSSVLSTEITRMWWLTPVITALRRLRRAHLCELEVSLLTSFKASHGYTVRACQTEENKKEKQPLMKTKLILRRQFIAVHFI